MPLKKLVTLSATKSSWIGKLFDSTYQNFQLCLPVYINYLYFLSSVTFFPVRYFWLTVDTSINMFKVKERKELKERNHKLLNLTPHFLSTGLNYLN